MWEGRSRNMAAIRSTNTKPELALRKALYAAGVRGWRCHVRDVPGKPEFAWKKWKIAVFVDGAFRHGHPDHFSFGRAATGKSSSPAQERDRYANEA